ncbi:MAG: polysaccharide deacetylase family protein [Thermus sp.]|uniref:polysaccharide deacetylase family protein n=1 Tax=Thermus sp. TaxID=275 RepID=UPI0025FC1F52|nr:polysaccharide deacetylase family protein [Thermus sp.]MCS7218512.1 polysaccharide deacetylase family protein [Thermus sp.]MCX7849936.1 polysaccharide deacetylase family protein [Thermus sp.]MDW8017963.1 polysaccharide deacetylase family protein [Thermus sp.]
MELALGVLLVYGLADLLFRFLGLGAYAHGSRREPKVALTFDDGPSERTEALLALLRRHGVRATFFLTGERAKAHPHLVAALKAEGHQVEDHGELHQALRLFLPWVEWRHMAQNPGRYYRPPHGLHTPFTRLFARRLGKRIALWDLESKDWLPLSPEALAERLLYYLRPGSVVLLHDGPERTLRLLEIALPQMLALGYRPVTLDELSPRPLTPRLALLRALQGFEERYNRKHRVERAGLGPFDLFRVEKKPFPGPDLPGFPKGTLALELHLESQRAMELSPFETIRHVRESLKKVAAKVAADPEVRLVYGHSYLAQGSRLFGFHTVPLPPWPRLVATVSSAWFLWLYRGELPRWERAWAELGYLSREELLRRFPPSTPASPPPAPGAGQSPPP